MKKNLLIIAFLFSSIMFGQTHYTNAAGAGDGKWSTTTNWTGGALPTEIAVLAADVDLDIEPVFVGEKSHLRSLGGSTVTLSSTTGKKLTITASFASSDGLVSNGPNFTYDAPIEFNSSDPTFIKLLLVNNTNTTGQNRQLTLGPNSVLTLTTNARVGTQINSKVVFQGAINGSANLQFTGNAEFAPGSTNTLTASTNNIIILGNANVVVNTSKNGSFFKNTNGGKLYANGIGSGLSTTVTLNTANIWNSILRSTTASIDGVIGMNLIINEDQTTNVGEVEMEEDIKHGSPVINLTVAAGKSVTFGDSSSSTWVAAGVTAPVGPGSKFNIYGFDNAASIKFGTSNTGLTATQLGQIVIKDGVSAGQAVGLDATGKLVLASSLITTWTGATSTDWTDATNWSNGVPNPASNVTIGTATYQPTIASNVTINSLAIASGATLSINEGKVLEVSGTITNAGDLLLKSSATGTASLLNTSAAPNVTQQRYLSSNQRGWRLLSNPLATTTFNALASASGITIGTNYTGEYLSASNTWTSTDGSASMDNQKAYKVFITGLTGEAPTYTSGPSNVTLSYKGTAANTAPAAIAATIGEFYLVANPYTAPVSLTSIIGASTGLSNTVSYYNPTKASTDVKVKAGIYDTVTVSGAAGSATDVVLPPMGAIFVQASSGGTIIIPKAAIYIGTVAGGSYNQKTAQTKIASSNALKVEVTSDGTIYDSLALLFKAEGNSGSNVDFGKLPNTVLDFYSINGSNNMAVSELELKEQTIPLGISSTVQKSYTFKVAENTIPSGYDALLVDNVLNTTTVLSTGTNYNFAIDSTPASQGNTRFAINLKTAGSLSVQANDLDTNIQLYPNPSHGQFNISNSQEGTSTIEISSLNGQVIHTQKLNSGINTIQTNDWAKGVYILKASNNGNDTTKKLIIQ